MIKRQLRAMVSVCILMLLCVPAGQAADDGGTTYYAGPALPSTFSWVKISMDAGKSNVIRVGPYRLLQPFHLPAGLPRPFEYALLDPSDFGDTLDKGLRFELFWPLAEESELRKWAKSGQDEFPFAIEGSYLEKASSILSTSENGWVRVVVRHQGSGKIVVVWSSDHKRSPTGSAVAGSQQRALDDRLSPVKSDYRWIEVGVGLSNP